MPLTENDVVEITGYEDWYVDVVPHMNPFNDNITQSSINSNFCTKSLPTENLFTRTLTAYCKSNRKSNNMDSDCYICHEELLVGEQVSSTTCDHTFHNECIHRWISSNNFNGCPVCRNSMKTFNVMNTKNETSVQGIISFADKLKIFSDYVGYKILNLIYGYCCIVILVGFFTFISMLLKSVHIIVTIDIDSFDSKLIMEPIRIMKRMLMM